MCAPEPVNDRTARWRLSRRDALKLALAAGVVAAPAVAGGQLLVASHGAPPPAAPIFVTPGTVTPGTGTPGTGTPGTGTHPSPLRLLHADAVDPQIWLELLRVEGLPYAQPLPLAALDAASLAGAAVVILLPGAVTVAQAELLRDYVVAGGGLIAVQPAAAVAPLCGLHPRAATLADGYLCVQPASALAAGIATGALQYHAPLQAYQLQEAEAVAYTCDAAGIATQTPAVTMRRLGQGAVAAWAYDLAQSVVYTRQGPPAHAGVETDGLEGVRTVDLFTGFVDLERIHIPQADEQQRLLVNLLHAVSATPLPRLWYFPHNASSVLVATGDAHNNPAPDVDAVLRRVESYGGAMSVYYTPPPTSTVRRAMRRVRDWARTQPALGDLLPPTDVVTPYHADLWRARGHEFALHPYVEEGLEIGWARYWQQFTGLGYGAFESTRTHRVLWHGWTDSARVQASYNVRMNLDYYHVGPAMQRADGAWASGYLTGSGLPMRFADAEGRLIDNWQQHTHLVDEQVIDMPWGASFVGSSPDAAVELAASVVRQAVAGAYAALGAQFHIDPFAVPGPWTAGAGRYLEGVLAVCRDLAVPILAAAPWLHFTRTRATAAMDRFDIDAATGRLSFSVHLDDLHAGLVLLAPARQQQRHLTVLQANGKQIAFTTRTVGATLYAVIALDSADAEIVARYVDG